MADSVCDSARRLDRMTVPASCITLLNAVQPRMDTDGPSAAEPQLKRSAGLPTRSRCDWNDGFGKSARARTGAAAAAGDSRARVPGRCLVLRDERFPPGACDANRSRTARSSPQGAGAKGRKANVRPQEHEWAERQEVGGECASEHEAQESLTASCRAQRRERKEQTLTRGDPLAERLGEVSRGHSSEDARRKPGRAKGRRTRRSQASVWLGHERTDETAERDNCGRDSGLTKRGPNEKVAQPARVSGMDWLRTGDGRPPDGPTAGCGKPHVRWCGRVPGRNPRHPTRSVCAQVRSDLVTPFGNERHECLD
jgi:hypothetical protein